MPIFLIIAALVVALLFGLISVSLRYRQRRPRIAPDFPPLLEQAYAIMHHAHNSARLVTHRNRPSYPEYLARSAALPGYTQTITPPPPATSPLGKSARVLVLDMQAILAQNTRRLHSYGEQSISRAEYKRLRSVAAHVELKLRELQRLADAPKRP